MTRTIGRLVLAFSGVVLAVCLLNGAAAAQIDTSGSWQLKSIEKIGKWNYDPKPQSKVYEADMRGPFTFGWRRPRTDGERVANLEVTFTSLQEVKTPTDWLSFDAKVTASVTGPGGPYAQVKILSETETASGYKSEDFPHMDRRIYKDKKEDFTIGMRMTQLLGSFPKEDFTVRLRLTLDDGGALSAREAVPYIGDLTILLKYKWMGNRPVEPEDNVVSGRWSGAWTNSRGDAGTSVITLKQNGDVITGDEDGWVIQNGRRNGNVLSWEYKGMNNGCRDYAVRFEISYDGRSANGSYVVQDKCEKNYYTGTYTGYRK